MRRLRGRADKINKADRANKITRCNIKKFFQFIHYHQ